MVQTSKQNKADPSVISAFSTYNILIVDHYSLQICRIGIILHFWYQIYNGFPYIGLYPLTVSTFTNFFYNFKPISPIETH